MQATREQPTQLARVVLSRGGQTSPKNMIRWLGRLGRCVGASDHAIFCLPCGVCFGCVLGHLLVTLQLHLHFCHYIEVVTCCNDSFSSPVRLSYVHRSCGEPRPTSVGFGARALSPPTPLLSALRRSLSPYRAGADQSVTCAMQVNTQDEEE